MAQTVCPVLEVSRIPAMDVARWVVYIYVLQLCFEYSSTVLINTNSPQTTNLS